MKKYAFNAMAHVAARRKKGLKRSFRDGKSRVKHKHVLRVANAPVVRVLSALSFHCFHPHRHETDFSTIYLCFALPSYVAYSTAPPCNLLTQHQHRFNSSSFSHPSNHLHFFLHSKVIVYRFHAMIKFNIPINFIHIH